MNIPRPIAISLSPDTESDDVLLALKTLFSPWSWKKGKYEEKVKNWFQVNYGTKNIFTFTSGRVALYYLLKSYGIGEGDEVIVQSFTCVAVPGPVLWTGAKAVYGDIDESLNLDPALLEKSITTKTKAIIVQHTFGIPARIELIKKITQKHNILLIEDCAHSLGATVNGQKVGTFGDAAFFSFGRDKVLSSVFGGLFIINNKSKASKLQSFKEEYQKINYPSYSWIFQQLLHPVVFALILPLYNLILGKVLLFVLQKLKLLSYPVYPIEKEGGKEERLFRKYPNALAMLACQQLDKLERYNKRRRQISGIYYSSLADIKSIKLPSNTEGGIYLRFNILAEKGKEFIAYSKKEGVILGNWYRNIIDPEGTNLDKIGFMKKKGLNSSKEALLSVNLPTYPLMKDNEVDKVIKLVRKYYSELWK
ncbi:MAG: DegT/DnrJ/EryC1/StrS aminotransferase [Candidatus Gottesmanbacteria bacterium GW2011_GWC2_39_8]|uniref:DegT/DnrJ/EryC1/StrS aminotransferase n=1 Tax=Candidatus Gottesmanbacteria bacterium GW2011_GWC2_39_8 TaxID=1618450 RepID=A0A0G0Q240_9BACT|nr:MAG: DegT/DnrJ/EryC1/StrS aminotransferase [Candidatus Gottesmanbacteria bacterium GW2011_GWC2_39_8]